MHKKMVFLGIGMMAFGIMGCNDYSSPKGVVGTAYKALKENNSKTFYKTLAGSALEEFGNEKGMSELQAALSGLELDLGEEQMTSEEKDFFGRPVLRNYAMPILAHPSGEDFKNLWMAEIRCELSYQYHHQPDYPINPPYQPIPHDHYLDLNSPANHRDEVTVWTTCKIIHLET